MNISRGLFGPSKKEAWLKLAAEIQGTYVNGGFWTGAKVQVKHEDWTITLDTCQRGRSNAVDTRLRVPFLNPERFQFVVSRRGIFTEISKRFGRQDIPVGQPEFEQTFIIRGNDETKLCALFADGKIRNLLLGIPSVLFSINDDDLFEPRYPTDSYVLSLSTPGTLKDLAQLELLFDLLSETMDQLFRMGQTRKGDTGVTF